MSNNRDENYISVGSWMWMMFVTALPIVGWIMIFIWAFTGDNESRKNYYRAILCWMLIFILLIAGLIVIGGATGHWQEIQRHVYGCSNKTL